MRAPSVQTLAGYADMREAPMLTPTQVAHLKPMVLRRYYLEIIGGRDGWACFYCGEYPEIHQLDHIKARSRGGPDDPENLVIACEECNRAKGILPGWLYLIERAGLRPGPEPLDEILSTLRYERLLAREREAA